MSDLPILDVSWEDCVAVRDIAPTRENIQRSRSHRRNVGRLVYADAEVLAIAEDHSNDFSVGGGFHILPWGLVKEVTLANKATGLTKSEVMRKARRSKR